MPAKVCTRHHAAPFLRRVQTLAEEPLPEGYPFNVPAFGTGIDIEFTTTVTFLVGDNGSGKSTLLEALADKCGFNLAGGNRDYYYEHEDTKSELSRYLRASWSPKVTDGFFLRAETFFNFGSYIDKLTPDISDLLLHKDRDSVQHQSHGEFFLGLFLNRRFQKEGI